MSEEENGHLRLVLIRPGCTDFDQQHRIQGTLDIPLNADGSTEVAQTIQELRELGIDPLYSSTCEPSLQSAQAMASALGTKLKRLDNMQNVDHGLWQGLLVDDVKRKHPKLYRQWKESPENIRPPEGETISEAQQRVGSALSKILRKHKSGIVGLVAPEPLASVVKCYVTDCQVGSLRKNGDHHPRWEVFDLNPVSANGR